MISACAWVFKFCAIWFSAFELLYGLVWVFSVAGCERYASDPEDKPNYSSAPFANCVIQWGKCWRHVPAGAGREAALWRGQAAVRECRLHQAQAEPAAPGDPCVHRSGCRWAGEAAHPRCTPWDPCGHLQQLIGCLLIGCLLYSLLVMDSWNGFCAFCVFLKVCLCAEVHRITKNSLYRFRGFQTDRILSVSYEAQLCLWSAPPYAGNLPMGGDCAPFSKISTL